MTTRTILTIKISGETDFDLEIAMEEVIRKVKEGYLSGFDSNETGDYEFSVSE